MITAGAVVTEARVFLQNVRDGIARLCELLESPKIENRDPFQLGRLRAAVILMERYVDTPMNFADATLVVLADGLETNSVLTLDERGFRTCRHGRNRPFQLILQKESR